MTPDITVKGDDIILNGVVLTDPVAARLVEAEGDEFFGRAVALANMLEVGARVMQRQQEGETIDYLRRELDILRERTNEALEAGGAQFVEAMRPVMENVSRYLAEMNGKLEGVSALVVQQQELVAERERGTAKGRDFEESVSEKIDEIARHQGDTCEHVGDTFGISGRAGDVLVEIDGANGTPRGRVVFEAKAGRISRPEGLREMDRAKETRSADYAVLVVAGAEKVPPGMFELREYGGDKMVVAYYDWSPAGIELAYSLARARVLARDVVADGADVQGALVMIEQAVQEFDRLRAIKLRLTSIAQASTETYEMIDDMVRVLKTKLEAAQVALASA